jgi:ribose transport system permease protein
MERNKGLDLTTKKGKILFKLMNVGKALILPVVITLIFLVTTSAQGLQLFSEYTDYQIFTRQVVVALLIAFAFGMHMSQGRMDFSIGATMILGEIITTQLMVKMGLLTNTFLFFILIVTITCALSVIGGLVYVLFRIPPMISGLGMTLLYEGIAYNLNEKASGTSRFDLVSNNFAVTFNGIGEMLILAAIIIIIMIGIYRYSKWSFDSALLQNGQLQAVQCGVKEVSNTLIGYALAGVLIGIAGFVTVENATILTASVGFGSTATTMSAMLPMFIGGFISSFVPYPVAICLGAISSTMLSYGLGKTFIMKDGSTYASIINALFLLFFLAYMFNQYKIKEVLHIKSFIANKKAKKALKKEMEGLE